MKKLLVMAAAAVMSMALMSCSDGSDSGSVSGAPATATGAVLENGATYESADNAWDGWEKITVTMTSATAGNLKNSSDPGSVKDFTIDTAGKVTYTGAASAGVTDILKVGSKIYAVGDANQETSATLFTTWTDEDGDKIKVNSDGSWTVPGTSYSGTFENNNGFITIKMSGNPMSNCLYVNNKLYNKVAEIVKQ